MPSADAPGTRPQAAQAAYGAEGAQANRSDPSPGGRHRLNDGNQIPAIGLGTWMMGQDEAAGLVGGAILDGYRLIDTAAMYGNEAGVGEAVRNAKTPRAQLYVTTKVWNDRHGFDATLRAFDESQKRLGLDYVDLYLIHWPAPRRGLYVDTWKALVRLRDEGRARSIGVSNFGLEHLNRVIDATGVVPAVNQVELHPRFQQRPLRATHESLGIRTEAWSPLGQGALLDDPVLKDLARRHAKSPAQVALRWHLDNGVIAIPKSSNSTRLRENLAIEDLRMSAADHRLLDGLDRVDGRRGADPDTADF